MDPSVLASQLFLMLTITPDLLYITIVPSMESHESVKRQSIVPFYLEEHSPRVPLKRPTQNKYPLRDPNSATKSIPGLGYAMNSDDSDTNGLYSAIQPVQVISEDRKSEESGVLILEEILKNSDSPLPNNTQNSPYHDKKSNRKISKEISRQQISDIRTFVSSPIERNRVLKCTLRRNKSGLKTFFPYFQLRTYQEQKPLLFAKKQMGNTSSNYRISFTKEQVDLKGKDYVGKLRSNFLGTGYNIFDDGHNPDKYPKTPNPRKVLGSIHYENTLLKCVNGPKRMEVYIPQPGVQTSGKQDLSQQYRQNPNRVILLNNRAPTWNQKMGAYFLDLQGRADKPSIKNFILTPQDNQQVVVLLVGKVDDDHFNIDICYPLSVIQALGIVLSSFDSKIGAE